MAPSSPPAPDAPSPSQQADAAVPRPPQADAPAAPRLDETMRWVLVTVAAVGVALTAAAGIGWGLRPALGVGIGAGIALANLVVFTLVVRGLLGPSRYRRVWILVAAIKLLVLFGGLYLLLRSGVASGLALVAGYGALPLGITIGGLIAPRAGEARAEPPG